MDAKVYVSIRPSSYTEYGSLFSSVYPHQVIQDDKALCLDEICYQHKIAGSSQAAPPPCISSGPHRRKALLLSPILLITPCGCGNSRRCICTSSMWRACTDDTTAFTIDAYTHTLLFFSFLHTRIIPTAHSTPRRRCLSSEESTLLFPLLSLHAHMERRGGSFRRCWMLSRLFVAACGEHAESVAGLRPISVSAVSTRQRRRIGAEDATPTRAGGFRGLSSLNG